MICDDFNFLNIRVCEQAKCGLSKYTLKFINKFCIGLKIWYEVGGIGVYHFRNFHMKLSFQIFGSEFIDDHSVFCKKIVHNSARSDATVRRYLMIAD